MDNEMPSVDLNKSKNPVLHIIIMAGRSLPFVILFVSVFIMDKLGIKSDSIEGQAIFCITGEICLLSAAWALIHQTKWISKFLGWSIILAGILLAWGFCDPSFPYF